MKIALDILTVLLVLAGLVFFVAGTLGVLRFPDALSRLHALTKADNLGLGLVVAGLALQASGPLEIMKLALIWFFVLGASAATAQWIAAAERRDGEPDEGARK